MPCASADSMRKASGLAVLLVLLHFQVSLPQVSGTRSHSFDGSNKSSASAEQGNQSTHSSEKFISSRPKRSEEEDWTPINSLRSSVTSSILWPVTLKGQQLNSPSLEQARESVHFSSRNFGLPGWRPIRPKERFDVEPRNIDLPGCLLRSCHQVITGRRLSYSRALQIVQKEAYLEEADTAVVVGRRKKREVWRKALIVRRQRIEEEKQLGRQCLSLPVPGVVPSCGPTVTPAPSTTTTPDWATSEDWNTVSDDWHNEPSDGRDNAWFMQLLPAAAGEALLSFLLILVLAMVATRRTQARRIPVASPLPGDLGGGQLPTGNSLVVLAALQLVPPGLEPVSVFPPYDSIREFEAVTVIFREESRVFPGRKKRSPTSTSFHHPLSQKLLGEHRGLTFLERLGAKAKGLIWRLRSEIHSTTRRMASSWMRAEYSDGPAGAPLWHSTRYARRRRIIFQDELFGFRTKIRLVDRQPCFLGDACDDRDFYKTRRQSGRDVSPFVFSARYSNSRQEFHNAKTKRRRADRREFWADGPPVCSFTPAAHVCASSNKVR